MPDSRTRRFEPWPFVLAAMLAAMIGVSIGFLRISLDHPDTPISTVQPERPR